MERPVSKPVKFRPEIPQNADVVFTDGTSMPVEEYVKEMSQNPELNKAEETVRLLESHCNLTQKKLLETTEHNRGILKDLERELNEPNPCEKSVKKNAQR